MIDHVRRARPEDAPTIVEFSHHLARETEGKELDGEVLGRGVEKVFTDPAKAFYLVAEASEEIVGQLMITFEWSDWRDGWIWWIQSVYVRGDWRRRGVFRALFEAVEREAKAAGDVVGLRLYVVRENSQARQTYTSLGMADADYLVHEKAL